jgi:HEAT repeat protein
MAKSNMRQPAKRTKKSPDATATVLRCLEHLAARDTTTWKKGANGLQRLGAAAIGPLIAIVTGREPAASDNAAFRRQAASAMYMLKLADPAAARALIVALDDRDPWVRSAASQALSRVAANAGVEIPDEAIAIVVRGLESCAVGSRYSSAMAMNEMAVVVKSRAAAAVPALIETLVSRDGEARCAAVASLLHIGLPSAPAAVELIRVLQEDKTATVRRAAALALPAVGAAPARSVPALVKALEDKNIPVAVAAAESLGKFGPRAKSAIRALEGLLQHKKPALRNAVAAALEQIRPV